MFAAQCGSLECVSGLSFSTVLWEFEARQSPMISSIKAATRCFYNEPQFPLRLSSFRPKKQNCFRLCALPCTLVGSQ